ncbi:hypothetical protein EYF80_014526 [Liparis tanakae]|uniref:Uncharacterized protein n=1 Tax=Liparis tanakae TaxID=230148 RepID=A0A4Z2IB41_9TELE|nr:hypothetical protein EYF80_014526 [Liparis tanakae]
MGGMAIVRPALNVLGFNSGNVSLSTMSSFSPFSRTYLEHEESGKHRAMSSGRGPVLHRLLTKCAGKTEQHIHSTPTICSVMKGRSLQAPHGEMPQRHELPALFRRYQGTRNSGLGSSHGKERDVPSRHWVWYRKGPERNRPAEPDQFIIIKGIITYTPQGFKQRRHGDITYRKPAAYVSERLLRPPAHAGPSPPSHTFLPGQQDGVLAGSSCIGAVEVSSVVVSYGLQQGPQLDVVLCQLGAVDRTAHHAAEMLYFLPAPYLRRLRVEEVFQELSGFLCSALSPRIRSRVQGSRSEKVRPDVAVRCTQCKEMQRKSTELVVVWPRPSELGEVLLVVELQEVGSFPTKTQKGRRQAAREGHEPLGAADTEDRET